ncbi:hypothetical protein [Paenirhodobacter ferrireducens]|uniref:hypothetical protein n=1 Tax=Paenirhodobacter ferrireducens TaxID=1215032 RepID=UPI0013E35023|nr:hypothetical protein [Sinirhodobacter ferrireducens]
MVSSYVRFDDVVFDVTLKGGEVRRVLLCNEYTFGMPQFYKLRSVYEGVQIFMIGGNWNSYDRDAKIHCVERGIGLYNSAEIFRAFCIEEFWDVHTKDKKGNKLYRNGTMRID